MITYSTERHDALTPAVDCAPFAAADQWKVSTNKQQTTCITMHCTPTHGSCKEKQWTRNIFALVSVHSRWSKLESIFWSVPCG